MGSEEIPQRSQVAPVEGTAPPRVLPDLNAGKYPFELVQQLLDRAAWINMYVIPDSEEADVAIRAPENAGNVIGISCRETIHRFDIDLQLPTLETGVRATNVMGERAGTLALRWMIIPYDFEAKPGREPPST